MNNQEEILKKLDEIRKDIPSSWRQISLRIGISYVTMHNFVHGEMMSALTIEKMKKFIKDYEKSREKND